jgi:hypothetical protein
MKILLVGTIVKDKIKFLDGTQFTSFGGLTHSINAALALCGENDRLIPLTRAGIDIYTDLEKMWPNDNRLIKDGFIPYNHKNNCVELTYLDSNERIEKSLHPMPPLHFTEIEPFLDVDVVMVNLISGWDIKLEFMLKLRAVFNGLIALDIHSLTLDRLSDGTRNFRAVTQIKPWLESADIIQLNEKEYEIISANNADPEVFFMQTCALKEKIINLTKGAYGSEIYRIKNNHCEVIKINANKNIKVIDPIGCGDTFFTVFGIRYFKSKNIKLSAMQANTAAALAGSVKGVVDPAVLRRQMKIYSTEDM